MIAQQFNISFLNFLKSCSATWPTVGELKSGCDTVEDLLQADGQTWLMIDFLVDSFLPHASKMKAESMDLLVDSTLKIPIMDFLGFPKLYPSLTREEFI